MKFIEDDMLKGLCKHLFAASGAMFSIATHIMTLEKLFSHLAEYAKRHRESLEVQSFKQNPSRESMVAYIVYQTLSHTEIVSEEEEGGSIWDTDPKKFWQTSPPNCDVLGCHTRKRRR